jgi:transposase
MRRNVEMGMPQKVPLRLLTPQEQQEMQRIVKATSERVDVVKRAKALQAVAQGCSFTEAGRRAGLSGDGVSQLVGRFNQRGLAVLSIAPGRGRKLTYGSDVRHRIVQEVQRPPDRRADATATWSLKTLERAIRKQGLSRMSASTIGRVLHDAGYSFQRTRTWCPTGFAQRVRKEGIVTVHDPQTEEKKSSLSKRINMQKQLA